ncbi:zinc finger CCCH-type containing 14 [Musa troglodytarum]|uniref:Zinc finger CCCH-type containing 14 n=1 Tax=Musa troglodytarum TaxID=320322 RepID=A0A9E7JWG1_9LILI|nr:zinc finger CCCH-type containing 14 [Musa troglodytarum]
MDRLRILASNSAETLLALDDLWRKSAGGGWATAVVMLLVSWQLLRLLFCCRRPVAISGAYFRGGSSARVANLITDADLRDLMISLEGKPKRNERWEDLIDKSSNLVSYKAKFFRPKDGPLKFYSVTTFEKCSAELLRDFYMDNQYRKKWDNIVIHHEQLQVKLSVAVPGRDACEMTLVHQEDAGINIELVKVGFAKGIWSYVSKMNSALREYSSCSPIHLTPVSTLHRLIKKIPPELEANAETSVEEVPKRSSSVSGRRSRANISQKKPSRTPKRWILANGLLLLGGIICLSRGRRSTTIGTQLAMPCILKKLMKHGTESS